MQQSHPQILGGYPKRRKLFWEVVIEKKDAFLQEGVGQNG